MKPAAPIALLLFAAAAAGCDSPSSEVDAQELTRAAKSLASLSAEAGLLARELGSNSVTLQFALVHQEALQQECLKVSRQLAKPVPDALRSAHRRELALSMQLQADVGQIAQRPRQAAQLAQLEQDLRRVTAQAKALEAPP